VLVMHRFAGAAAVRKQLLVAGVIANRPGRPGSAGLPSSGSSSAATCWRGHPHRRVRSRRRDVNGDGRPSCREPAADGWAVGVGGRATTADGVRVAGPNRTASGGVGDPTIRPSPACSGLAYTSRSAPRPSGTHGTEGVRRVSRP
jgi:hypothetical protein